MKSQGSVARLWVGDCLVTMPLLQAESVDLVLTDPPYGIGFHTNRRRVHRLPTDRGIANDRDNLCMLEEAVENCWRVLRPDRHVYWFTRWDKLPVHLPLIGRRFPVKNVLIWDKGGSSLGDLSGAYASTYECIIFAHKGRRPLGEVGGVRRHPDILRVAKVPSHALVHGHQKPVGLLDFLVQKSTQLGEVVLDPFAGSGSALLASARLGRQAQGIELDARHAAIALARLLSAGVDVEVRRPSDPEERRTDAGT